MLTISAALAAVSPIGAQQPRADSDWSHVQALQPGTTVDVKAKSEHLHCKVSAVASDALSCSRASTGAEMVLQRSDIRSVRISHRGRSALIGAGVGGGGLAIALFATTSSNDGFFGSNFLRGPATGLGALAGGLIGGGIGALSDFSHTTIYRAP